MAYSKVDNSSSVVLKKWSNITVYDAYGRDKKYQIQLYRYRGKYFIMYKEMYKRGWKKVSDKYDVNFFMKRMREHHFVRAWLEINIQMD